MILRRLFVYLVSAAALSLLTSGLVLLGGTILLFVFNDPSAESSRGQLAYYTAMIIAGLLVWAPSIWYAQRLAHDPYERASALRRLYLYWACLAGSLAAMVALSVGLSQLLMPVFDNEFFTYLSAAQAGWAAIVFAAVWGLHFFIAWGDRAAVGEEGASSTLRRWYMYAALLIGLLTMLAGMQISLQLGWYRVVTGGAFPGGFLSSAIAQLIAGALLWAVHARVIAIRHISEDRHSTLRAVEGFIAVAVSIATALFGASQILYYALARVLGVPNPGNAGTDVLAAVSTPGSQLLVYGVAWILVSRRLARDAGTQEADRQAGIRRLYTNLAALISLAAGATGAGWLLWTLLEHVEAPLIGVRTGDWKDPISISITLLVVGAAVWIANWRHAPWAADRQSLSRKLYVWAALLGSVLAVLGGAVGMINAVLQQVFSANPRLDVTSNLDFAHYLAVILVAAGVGFYHFIVLRADAAARPPRPAVTAPKPATVTATTATQPVQATEALGPHSHRYTLVVSEATEDDVHQALASLPPQANYRLTPAEQTVDGR
ncbi:MAG TPA: DUF5671 domain-containing protein [Candidatus Dormibacteraeota bacterium]